MRALLKKYFNYDEFRPMQEAIVNNVLKKKDTFVLMSTGGGKSICYQLPALKFKGLTVVISPLISLMKDQVDALRKKGVNADYINSSLSSEEIFQIREKISSKQTKILYIAPERLALEEFRSYLLGLDISLIAIDEAHCISEWGHDFRRDYRNLKFIKIIFPDIPIIALTATATEKVRLDILKQLSLEKPAVFISSFNRDNLNLIVMKKKNNFSKILNLVNKQKEGAIIIYCFSRKDCENIAQRLENNGFGALPYHAGLTIQRRRHNQELFIKNDVKIIVATIAFGMGIDKSNVRLIIHNTFSKTLESYYQEIGRAGRDGISSDCIVLYSAGDKRKHEFFINQIKDSQVRKRSRDQLKKMMDYCESKLCRRKHILEYFGEHYPQQNCNGCDICLGLPEITEESKFRKLSFQEFGKKIFFDEILFEKLKEVRLELANFIEVPAFIIFSDDSLKRMAFNLPRNKEEFLKIKGVGSKKLKEYGRFFLDVISDYLEKSKIL